MHFWNSLPLFRLIIPFILGILFSNYFYFEHLIVVCLILLLTLFIVKTVRVSYTYRWVFGVLAWSFSLAVGVWINPNSLDLHEDNFYIHSLTEENAILLEVIEEPIEKPNSFKTIAKVLSVNEKQTCGTLLLYLDKRLDSIEYGSRLMIIKRPQKIGLPKNPFQFNFSAYLYHKGISHQLYLSENDVILLDNTGGKNVVKFIISIRKNLLALLNASDLSKDGKAVSSALLFGHKSDMNSELKQSFSRSGVIHILAVSGLHVGIIYLLLNTLFAFMNRKLLMKWIKLLLILFSLWFYAFLTNLSPSVMRAATLFSFIAIGSAIDRNTNIYNTLSASAFVLLIINPHYIYEVGFQLSYLAVLGIVSLYPKLYELISCRFYLLDKIWQLLCVSLSAQLFTFPLIIYYFHQFSNYFLLSNLLVVPLVPVIIYCGLGFIAFSTFEFFNEPFLLLLNFLIELLIKVVRFMESIPYSFSDFLFFNVLQVLLIYFIIAFVLYAFYYQKRIAIFFTLILIVLFQIIDWQGDSAKFNKNELVFYSVNKYTAFGIVSNGEGVFFMSEELIKDSVKQEYNFYNHWIRLGQSNPQIISLDSNMENSLIWKKENHLQLGHSRLLWINDDFKIKTAQIPIEIDYCLISDYFPIEKVLQTYRPKQIILDAALSYYEVQQLDKECQHLNVKYYSLKKDKALIVNLKN